MESLQTVRKIGSMLKKEVGWSWPIFLLQSVRVGNAVFRRTQWATSQVPRAEASFAKRLSLLVGIYIKLRERVGQQRAREAVGKGFLTLSLRSTQKLYNSLGLNKRRGMDRFMAFIGAVEHNSEAQFNRREYVTVDETTCHYVINRCMAYDFFSAAGTPELIKPVCRLDEVFFPRAFPDLTFSRGDSWQNTIACGKDHCEYLLTLRRPVPVAEGC